MIPDMGTELETTADATDCGISERQVNALDQLTALGKAPREPDASYDKSPKVRALQLVYEGRLGGPNRGQGRKRKQRASEVVAEHIRNKLTRKIINAIEEGLDDDNKRVKLQAADMAMKIDREDAELSMKEVEADLDNASREELLATLFSLAGDQNVATAIEATAQGHVTLADADFEEVTEAEVVGEPAEAGSGDDSERADGPAPDPSPARPQRRAARANGRGRASRSRENGANPITAAAKRRAAKR